MQVVLLLSILIMMTMIRRAPLVAIVMLGLFRHQWGNCGSGKHDFVHLNEIGVDLIESDLIEENEILSNSDIQLRHYPSVLMIELVDDNECVIYSLSA